MDIFATLASSMEITFGRLETMKRELNASMLRQAFLIPLLIGLGYVGRALYDLVVYPLPVDADPVVIQLVIGMLIALLLIPSVLALFFAGLIWIFAPMLGGPFSRLHYRKALILTSYATPLFVVASLIDSGRDYLSWDLHGDGYTQNIIGGYFGSGLLWLVGAWLFYVFYNITRSIYSDLDSKSCVIVALICVFAAVAIASTLGIGPDVWAYTD